MKTPLICDDHGCIDVFPTIEDAALYLEPIDIQNGEYRFWDADGFVVDAYVSGKPKQEDIWDRLLSFLQFVPNTGTINFVLHSPLENQEVILTNLLKGYLSRQGITPSGTDLDELLSAIPKTQ